MRLAILTPDPEYLEYTEYSDPLFLRYEEVFGRIGVEVAAAPWTEPLPDGLDAAAPMLAWGYHLQLDRWRQALDAWEASTTLVNSANVLRWNTRKTYLTEMALAGVPIVPTVMAPLATQSEIERAAKLFNSDELVVKPQVSAAGFRTVRLRRGETPSEILPDAMIQPFLPAVNGDGELSLFFFGGRFAYAVRKVAAAGEFRVQPHYGGTLSLFEPTEEALETAALAVAAAPEPVTYARVDLVRGWDGQPLLMEFEAIEPDLYFHLAPDGGLAYAQAVVSAVSAARA